MATKSSRNTSKLFLPELFLLFSDGVNVVVFDLGNLASSPRYDVHVDHGVNEQQQETTWYAQEI